jgi:hypothetical protein
MISETMPEAKEGKQAPFAVTSQWADEINIVVAGCEGLTSKHQT